MERTPEPELMNDPEGARAYSEADFAEPHTRFVDLLEQRLGARLSGRALDLGCGPADVTARVAQRFSGLTIDGVDGAPEMLALGRARLARQGLDGRVTLHACRLPDDPLPGEAYALVFSNSLLHHMHDPRGFWATVAKARGPGGAVFVMDLMRPATEAVARAMTSAYTAGEPEVLQRDFFCSLKAAFTAGEVHGQLQEAGLGDLTLEIVSDRHLIAWGR